jgi:hypothetical protein
MSEGHEGHESPKAIEQAEAGVHSATTPVPSRCLFKRMRQRLNCCAE